MGSADLTEPQLRLVVPPGLDSLGPGLCDQSVLCADHLDVTDIETVLSTSIPITIPVPTEQPIIDQVAIEEEKLGGLESSAEIITDFHELIDCGSEDPELDQIL